MRGLPPRGRKGFTLVEVVISLLLVGLTLGTMLQILHGTKFTAAHTRDARLARELAMRTLAEIETGKWWDEIDTRRSGTYADIGRASFFFDLAVGDETLEDREYEDDDLRPFDNWAWRREQEYEDDDLEEDEETTEPFEKVRIRVTFPKYGDLPNELVFERWIRWEQVYGEPEEEAAEGEGEGDAGAGGGTDDGF